MRLDDLCEPDELCEPEARLPHPTCQLPTLAIAGAASAPMTRIDARRTKEDGFCGKRSWFLLSLELAVKKLRVTRPFAISYGAEFAVTAFRDNIAAICQLAADHHCGGGVYGRPA